jgi:hypothetical protein
MLRTAIVPLKHPKIPYHPYICQRTVTLLPIGKLASPSQVVGQVRACHNQGRSPECLQSTEPGDDSSSLMEIKNLLLYVSSAWREKYQATYLNNNWTQSLSLASSDGHDIPSSNVRIQAPTVCAPQTTKREHDSREEVYRPAADCMRDGYGQQIADSHIEGRPGCKIVGLGVTTIRHLNNW